MQASVIASHCRGGGGRYRPVDPKKEHQNPRTITKKSKEIHTTQHPPGQASQKALAYSGSEEQEVMRERCKVV